MEDILFSIPCPTCQRMLAVRDEAAIGAILPCGRCGSMVQVVPPAGWKPQPKSAATPESVSGVVPEKMVPSPPAPLSDREEPRPAPSSAATAAAVPVPASPIVQSPGGPVEPPPVIVPAAAGAWKLVLLAASALGLAGAGTAAYFGLRGNEPVSVETDEGPVREQAAVAEPSPAPRPAGPVPLRLDRRWLPDKTKLLVSLRLSELDGQEQVERVLQAASPVWSMTAGSVIDTLGLKFRCVRRLTWAACDLTNWPAQSVALIELEEGQNAVPLRSLGEPVRLQIASAPCHRMSKGSWTHPFAVLDERTILTGSEQLLRELAERSENRLESPAIDRLFKATTPDAHFVLLDLGAAREAGWPRPSQWLDAWPAGRDAWRLVTDVPKGLGLFIKRSPQPASDLALWCEGESAAEKVRGAIEQLLPAARAALASRASSLPAKLQAGRLTAAAAQQYEVLLKDGRTALETARCDVADDAAWLRIGWKDRLPALADAALTSPGAVRADWLEAGLLGDDANHRRLLAGLGGFVKAQGHFPAGADGGVLLPPNTRLSWIATMLPYYGHLDWSKELQSGYSWNSPQNRPVTQRPLDAVLNPLVDERTTDAGFPVTHYVGLAGVGPDAGNLPANDPRAGVFGFSRTTRPEEIPDGASNTVALVGVAKHLGPWGAGGQATVRSLTRRPYINGPDGFGSGQPDGMVVGMADGGVRFFSKDIDPAVLEQLATIGGREKLSVALVEPKSIVLPQAVPEPEKPSPAEKPVAEKPAPVRPGPASKEPARPSPEEQAAEEDDGPSGKVDVEARLADPVREIHFTATPLVEALRLLSQMSTLRITLDLDAMTEAGVGLRDPISVKLSDASMGEVLRTALASRKLIHVVDRDQVLVTTVQKRGGGLRPQKYGVADLAGANSAPGDLAELVRKLVAPETWRQAGGPGTVEVSGESLEVNQTDSVHFQVKALLEKLRAAREKPQGAAPDKLLLATRFDRARAKLRQAVTVNFPQPSPLSRVLGDLEDASKTTILVDWTTVLASGVAPDAQGTLRVHDQPLSESLVGLLQPLGLTYRIVAADVFEVISRKAAAARLELEFYPIGGLVAKNQAPEAIVERIKEQVAPSTWSDAGGPAAICFDKLSNCLMVLQSQPAQVKVQFLLAKLAAELGVPADRGAARDPPPARRR